VLVLTHNRFRSAIATLLMFWCAGAGCMLVSYAHTMSMAETDSVHAQPVMHKAMTTKSAAHSCCKARHGSSKRTPGVETEATSQADSQGDAEQIALAESSAPVDAMSCCPLTTGSFVTTSRTSADANGSAPAQNHSPPFELSNLQPAPLALPLRLPDAEHTYLRCCVFLI
jgi:hypothetical protein